MKMEIYRIITKVINLLQQSYDFKLYSKRANKQPTYKNGQNNNLFYKMFFILNEKNIH